MEKNIAVWKKLEVVVPGVATLGSAGFMFPDYGSVGFADCEDIFAIGGTDEDEAIFLGD